jgi:hypothetical protein
MATSKSKKQPWVAIVITSRDDLLDGRPVDRSQRPLGDWACFVGADRDATIKRAIRARDAWQRASAGSFAHEHEYDIFVGRVESKVVIPSSFELADINDLDAVG